MLNVQRLRMLREVASRGTIAAAAEAFFMSPSAVSQQMAVLEREAGCELLQRSGRGVKLTEAGRGLVANTERILAEMERAEAELAAASQGVVGQITVSAFPTASKTILIPALVQLEKEHPNLTIQMIDLEPEESLPALKARDLDVALAYEWSVLPVLQDPGVSHELLLTEQVLLELPRDHPLALRGGPVCLADLEHEEWIVGRDSTSLLDLVTAAARQHGYVPRTKFHSMDFDVILTAVSAGLGVALGPGLALLNPPAEVALREIGDQRITRSVWATIRRGSDTHPGVAMLLAAVRESARAAADRLQSVVATG